VIESRLSRQAAEKPQQVRELIVGNRLAVRVAVGDEDILELGGPAVVEKRVALADAAERGGIEPGHTFLIAQTDVVDSVRRISLRRNMALHAAAALKQRLA